MRFRQGRGADARELVLAIGIPLLVLLLAALTLEHRHRADDHWSVAAALVAAALRLRPAGRCSSP
jgi:uncharacterized membrane protein YhhN